MPTLKRSASPELLTRPSPYHSSVTLYDTAEQLASTSSLPLRRSKRVKVKVEADFDEPVKVEESSYTVTVKRRKSAKRETASAPVKLEQEGEEDREPSSSKTRSPRKPKLIPQALAVPHPAPPRWQEAYDTIKQMRSKITAPVDTMGCDQAQLKESDPKSQRFATLVSLMLSSQTKDEVTDAAVAKLRQAVGGTLTVDAVLNADNSAISEAIAKVGFWRRKTQYLKQTAQRLRADFNSDVPKTVDELCSLPGVGPKMAFLALQVAWNINAGIGVDVHVHRITNRLGWHKRPTKNPEETRLNLQSWLPTELHPEINHLLVGFGQTVCLPVGPRCTQCELSSGLCPSVSVTKATNKKSRVNSRVAGPKIEIEVEAAKDNLANDAN